jgi:hypothetical protein
MSKYKKGDVFECAFGVRNYFEQQTIITLREVSYTHLFGKTYLHHYFHNSPHGWSEDFIDAYCKLVNRESNAGHPLTKIFK